MRIYKRIGCAFDEEGNYLDGVVGAYFAEEMAWLSQQADVNKINVRINSGGGNVLDGYAIVSSILNCSVPVDTYIDGLAASMAAVIAVCGKKCMMADYGTFMIHEVQGDDKKVVTLFTETINTILTKRCGMGSEQVGEMMKKETWMNAEECLKMGFIDKIVNSDKKVNVANNATLEERLLVYNEILTPTNKMKEIAKSLGLPENATEAEIVNAINALNTKKTNAENEATALKTEKVQAENAAKEARKVKATVFANSLKEKGILTNEAEVNSAIENAATSENSLSLLERMASVKTGKEHVNVFDKNQATNAGTSTGVDSWTFDDWSKKNPNGLLNMQKTEPEKFQKLYENKYGKK